MPVPMTAEQADAVYDVLVEHCGASESNRTNFTFFIAPMEVAEYRFVGALGFGGKFRRSGREDRWYVDCCEEDLTDERQRMIDAANKVLAVLRERVAT